MEISGMHALVHLLILSFLLCSCGIESGLSEDFSQPSQAERAVFIANVQTSPTGNIITCELNDAIVSPGVEIPLFLEYEGDIVQQTTLSGEAEFTFNPYNPPSHGSIVCVVEFANAEFESEATNISNVP